MSLQNGGLNQTTFLFLFFPRFFLWLISPTLISVRVPPLLFLTLELRTTGVKYSSLPWNPLSFRASLYLLLFSSKIFLHEDSLFILWFTALGICLSTDLGWFEEIFMYLGAESFLLNGLNVPLFCERSWLKENPTQIKTNTLFVAWKGPRRSRNT